MALTEVAAGLRGNAKMAEKDGDDLGAAAKTYHGKSSSSEMGSRCRCHEDS